MAPVYYTPYYGKIYKYMPRALERVYGISGVATFCQTKVVSMAYHVQEEVMHFSTYCIFIS